jgi:triosephosphate isomerase
MIFVNFKTYEEGTGQNALRLTSILEEVATNSQVKIIPVVQIIDAEMVIASTKLPVWIQHVDPVGYGAHTGWTLPEEAARIGVSGVFLNHSEHKFDSFDDLYVANEKALSANLKTLIFAGDINELKRVCDLAPTYVAYEPPDLVGSTTTSVTSAKSEVISEAYGISKSFGIPLVVGAGIHTQDDIRKSLNLGAVGFAIATNIVKSVDPKKSLEELVEGFK